MVASFSQVNGQEYSGSKAERSRMECNRDEALRAREIAESRFMANDIAGAKRFALQAQRLYPELDGISQMIATLNIHLSGEAVVNGEKDWYSVLDLSASDDEEIVKKQYRKFALMLHPDKNKSIGAEGAFKLISEAWSILSDRSRRIAYDQKLNVKGYKPGDSQPNEGPYSNATNGFHSFEKSPSSGERAEKSSSRGAPSATPQLGTFWTSCNHCKMQYEYLRIYLNHNLLCPSCHEPFLAFEIPVPINRTSSSIPWAAKKHQRSSDRHNSKKSSYGHGKTSSVPDMRPGLSEHGSNRDPYDCLNFQNGAFYSSAGSFSTSAQTANMVHQPREKVAGKRQKATQRKPRCDEYSEFFHAGYSNYACNMERLGNPSVHKPAKKKKNMGESEVLGCRTDDSEGTTLPGTARVSFNNVADLIRTDGLGGDPADHGRARVNGRQSSGFSRGLVLMDVRNMLIMKGRAVVRRKLEDLDSAAAAAAKFAAEEAKRKGEEARMAAQGPSEAGEGDPSGVPPTERAPDDTHGRHDKPGREGLSMDVADPDFHDFDGDRSERCFEADQVWATYDDEDGMPRFYAMIQRVLSVEPFRVRLSFLNSKSNSEFGPLNWVGSGFTKTCGDFRVGKHQVHGTVNIFSHRVSWAKGPRGVVRVVPRRGDVWAVYKNWRPDWDEHTPDEVVHEYEMVRVVEDYSEDGVCVAPLEKVPGFRTVFCGRPAPEEVRRVPREEMFRFSHQVPYFTLTGEEAENIPKGSCELDPAATPAGASSPGLG